MPQLGFAEHQLEVALSQRALSRSVKRGMPILGAHLLTVAVVTVVGPMLTGAANQVPIRHLIGSTWGYQKLKTSVNSNSKITCLAMAEKIWQIFHGRNPHTHRCCSSHKCMFLTNGATKQAFQRYNIYCPKALLPQRINRPNTNFLTFCAKFI